MTDITEGRTMRDLLDFDDAGASDNEPAKGVTIGDIRAWHDKIEAMSFALSRCYDAEKDPDLKALIYEALDL
jgi:hypothetical protein